MATTKLISVGAALVSKKFASLGKSMDKFKTATDSAKAVLGGISEGSNKVVSGFTTIKDKFKSIFGKLKTEANKKGGSSIVDQSQTDELDGHLKQLGTNYDALQSKVSKLGLVLAASLLPVVIDLVPVISEMIPHITSLVGSLVDWLDANPELTKSIATFVAGIWLFDGPLKSIFSGISMVTGGVQALGKTIMANPILLLVGVIAFAAAAIIANWDKVKQFLLTLWEPIKPYVMAAVTTIGNFIKNYVYFIAGLFTPVIDGILLLWDGLASTLTTLWDAVEPYWTGFTDNISNAFQVAAAIVLSTWEPVKSFFSDIWESVKPIWEEFGNWIGKLWGKITKPIEYLINLGKSTVGKLGSKFKNNSFGKSDKNYELASEGSGTTLAKMMDSGQVSLAGKNISNVSAPITIHAAEGMNESMLAELVAKSIDKIIRQGQVAGRSTTGGYVQ